MNKDSLLENLFIYNDNLSVYYLVTVFITVLSVVVAWWYHNSAVQKEEPLKNKNENSDVDLKDPLLQEYEKEQIEQDPGNDAEIISKIKLGRSSLLAEEVAATLTQEQLNEEREVERKQLEAIFNLLQNEEDKFQVSSIQDLEDQLKLYRQ